MPRHDEQTSYTITNGPSSDDVRSLPERYNSAQEGDPRVTFSVIGELGSITLHHAWAIPQSDQVDRQDATEWAIRGVDIGGPSKENRVAVYDSITRKGLVW